MKTLFVKNRRIIEFIIVVIMLFVIDIALDARFNFRIKPIYYLHTLASISLVPSFILFFKSSKVRFILYAVVTFVSFALLVTDSCLYYYKGDVFSLAMILDIGDGIRMGIKYNIFVAFSVWEWLILAVMIIFGFVCLGYLSLGKNKQSSSLKFSKNFINIFCLLMVIFGGLLVPTIDKKIYSTPQDKRTHIVTFGMATFYQRDVINTVSKNISKAYLKVKASQQLSNVNKKPADVTKVTGSFAGKNVIMIMMETVEEYAIDQDLTPTLYYLLNDGYKFTKTYGVAKTNNTYDAEFKSLTSMMYYNTDNYMYSYDDNEFTNSLPAVLKAYGYTANSFHSNVRTYFNRENMHAALGFDHYYADESMTFSKHDGFPLDSEMFAQMKDLIAPVQDAPFFSFIITYSTHGPFAKDVSNRKAEFEKYYVKIEEDGRYKDYEEQFINLLAAQMNLDEGLAILVEDLKQKDLLDDTLIVLFSDHKNYSSMDITKKYSNSQTTDDVYDYNLDIVPFSIYNPNIQTRHIDYVTSQYDITPTIFDLLGIEYVKEYYYGQSVFLYDSNQYESKPIIFGYNRWIDTKMITYDREILYCDPSITDPEEYYAEIQSQVFDTIEKFHAFFITDYFRKTAIE